MEALHSTFCLRSLGVLAALLATPLTVLGQFGFPAVGDSRTRDFSTSGQNFGWGFGGQPINNDRNYLTPPMNQTWVLGVAVENTERGVLITRVQPGSAAQQARLEQGDIVLTVGGFQVGYVDRQLYDLGDEIRRRANSQGQVTLLVLNQRTGQLELLNVGLQQNAVAIRGRVYWRDRGNVPQGSVLQVRVDNLTRNYISAGGDTRTFNINQTQPIPFEMNLDRQSLSPSDRYQIQAAVLYGGQLLYTMQPIAVDLFNNPGSIDLELVSAANATGNQYSVGYSSSAMQEIGQYYQQFLRRQPTQAELQAWLDHFSRGRSRNDLPISLLSSPQFFESVGNNNQYFINQLFRLAAGRDPSQAEMNQWVLMLQQTGNRTAVVRDFYTSLRR